MVVGVGRFLIEEKGPATNREFFHGKPVLPRCPFIVRAVRGATRETKTNHFAASTPLTTVFIPGVFTSVW